MSIIQLLDSARAALARRAYREAHTACMDVLKQDPKNAEAFFLLGILTSDHANHQKAIELFDRALALTPGMASAVAYKSRSLIALNRREEALEAVRTITDLDHVDSHTLDTFGVVLSRAGRHEEALRYYQAALRDGSDQANSHYNYGAALQFLGRMNEARDAYQQAIACDPDDARSYAAIVTITKQTEGANDIAKLEALFPRFAEDSNARLNIGHAIAKAYDDLGQGALALQWLGKAKALKKQELGYDPAFDSAVFEQVHALTGIDINDQPDALGPIFITGMPRTGTTLVDRIISSHSQVTPAGELTDFGLLLKRAVRSPGPYVLDAGTLAAGADADLAKIGADYVANVRKTIAISTSTFTDKMPLNILYAPLLLKAMPNARVICLRRHPADTVLSNYRQLFATTYSYYNYAYDLETAARYYAKFARLVDHFTQTLPAARFTTVAYESVVGDIETETRRLLAFCGLDFEQACVDFHTNQAPVATASSAQVRQPLYASALARWKRYRPGLESMLNILVEEGCLDPAELID
jgi:tetratricopeptide (TPR) repeat protein